MPRREPGRRVAAALLAAVVVLGALAACSSGGDDEGRRRRTTSSTTPTSLVDYSTVVLAAVPGATTSTILDRGRASIVGTVTGPDGPVAGATVRVERLVADEVRRTDVPAGGDGRYALRNVPGGRYRVRAFLPPSYAQLESQLFFMPDGEEHRLDLRLERFEGLTVLAAIAPDPPRAGDAANLVVQVQTREVDGDGFVRAVPMSGVGVQLVGGAQYTLRSSASATTDGGGRATFGLVCNAPGPSRFSVILTGLPVDAPPPPSGSAPASSTAPAGGTAERALDVPDCAAGAPSSSTTSSTSDSSSTTDDIGPGNGNGNGNPNGDGDG
jgi:hypothetical protein